MGPSQSDTATIISIADREYRTATESVPLLARLFPSLYLYAHFFAIVLRASSKSKRDTYTNEEWCQSSLDTLRALEHAGVNFEITGIEHIAHLETPCVMVGNHMSVLETTVLPVLMLPFRDLTYVVKQSLLDYPVFRHIMRSCEPIAVTRTDPRQDLKTVLEGGVERLKKGVSVVVFPQTTRTSSFDPAQFNSIGVKLARRAGVPVVPLAVKTDAWSNGRYLKDFGSVDISKTVHLCFGAPLSVEGRGTEEHQAIVEFITKKLEAWRTADER